MKYKSLIIFCLLLSADALSDDLTTCKNLTDNYIFSQAIIVCEQLCNKNIGSGCLAMGDIYITPQFENHNLEKSKSFYDKSCNLDDALGCFKVAELYYYTPRPNYTLSLEYSRKSCHLNNADGCFLLARSYELGKGVQPDPNRAKQYYKVSWLIIIDKPTFNQDKRNTPRFLYFLRGNHPGKTGSAFFIVRESPR